MTECRNRMSWDHLFETTQVKMVVNRRPILLSALYYSATPTVKMLVLDRLIMDNNTRKVSAVELEAIVKEIKRWYMTPNPFIVLSEDIVKNRLDEDALENVSLIQYSYNRDTSIINTPLYIYDYRATTLDDLATFKLITKLTVPIAAYLRIPLYVDLSPMGCYNIGSLKCNCKNLKPLKHPVSYLDYLFPVHKSTFEIRINYRLNGRFSPITSKLMIQDRSMAEDMMQQLYDPDCKDLYIVVSKERSSTTNRIVSFKKDDIEQVWVDSINFIYPDCII